MNVTKRIKEIKQPYGGYIKPSQFKKIELHDDNILNSEENIHASIIGMAVDYLTRFIMGKDIKKAFEISISGYLNKKMVLGEKNKSDIFPLLEKIKGLDDTSIISACKAVTYDVWYRNPNDAIMSTTEEEINPSIETIENIRIMVKRSMAFWEKYGEITVSGFSFEPTGYTETVNSGDGDYLTKDTLWDFKVSRSNLTSKNTLQLLMYWIMGKHSGKLEFKNINKLGVFNPRLNIVYLLETSEISQEIIKKVENDVICY